MSAGVGRRVSPVISRAVDEAWGVARDLGLDDPTEAELALVRRSLKPAAPAEGQTVATVVHGIGGRSERVEGTVVAHRLSRRDGSVYALDVRTEFHGVIVVELGKVVV